MATPTQPSFPTPPASTGPGSGPYHQQQQQQQQQYNRTPDRLSTAPSTSISRTSTPPTPLPAVAMKPSPTSPISGPHGSPSLRATDHHHHTTTPTQTLQQQYRNEQATISQVPLPQTQYTPPQQRTPPASHPLPQSPPQQRPSRVTPPLRMPPPSTMPPPPAVPTILPPSPPLTRAASSAKQTRLSDESSQNTIAAPDTSAHEYASKDRRHSTSGITRQKSSAGSRNPASVDYLLPHGGLAHPISIAFSLDSDPTHVPDEDDDDASDSESEQDPDDPPPSVFAPLHLSLDAYAHILSRGGSLAVGTGYRSVARRLLERVEGIFARDIGVPWAEALEWLRGGRTLPKIPVCPLDGLTSEQPKEEVSSPIVGPEAAHVALQPREKPRSKVEKWLEQTEHDLQSARSRPTTPTPGEGVKGLAHKASVMLTDIAPSEVQERIKKVILQLLQETAPEQREKFESYLSDRDLIKRSQTALVRLYPGEEARNINPPITALYLLLHPNLHRLLDAVSRINKGELELINLGKFDGFLDEKAVSIDEESELQALRKLEGNIERTMAAVRAEMEELEKRVQLVQEMTRTRRDAILRKRELEERQALERSASTVVAQKETPQSPPRTKESEERPPVPLPFRDVEDDAQSIISSAMTPTCCALGPDDSASNAPSRRRKKHHHHHSSSHSGVHRSRDPTRRSSSRVSRDPRSGSRSRRKRVVEEEQVRSVEEVLREGERNSKGGVGWPKQLARIFSTSEGGKERKREEGVEPSAVGSVKKREREKGGTVVGKEGREGAKEKESRGRLKEDGTRETREEREGRREREREREARREERREERERREELAAVRQSAGMG